MAEQDQARDGNGRFTRTIDSVRRDAEAAKLRAKGKSYREIAEELGYSDKGDAYRAIQNVLKEAAREPAEELRALELERLDRLYEAATEVLERQHVTVSHGKVIYHGDEPLEDDGPVLAAIDRLLRIQERRARLLGLDAPSRVSVDAEKLGAEIGDLLTALTPSSDDDSAGA